MMITIRKSKLKKLCFACLLIIAVCVLTFMKAIPISAYAANTGTTGTTGTENATDTTEADDDLGLDATTDGVSFSFNTGDNNASMSATLQMLLVLTVISLAPSILIMMTSFIRIIIVLHFARSALGTQTTPPNQVLVGLALFLTFFIMSPVFQNINTNAIQPLSRGEISQEVALERGLEPIREFMFNQINPDKPDELKLFLNLSGINQVDSIEDVPTTVLIPAFILSELKKAFIIGFLIYIPFIIIDMVVASTLMSMGMMMLPPTTISMPFKILLFIMADGWNLIIGSVIKSFY